MPSWGSTASGAGAKPSAVKLKLTPKGPVGIGSKLLPGARTPGPTSQANPASVTNTTPINPFDPAVESQISAAATKYAHTLTGLQGEQDALNHEYDPNNPMGKQAMLKQQFQATRGAQHINQASSGQLYSGSSATEDAFTNQDEGFANTSLGDQYRAATDAISGRRQAASDDTLSYGLSLLGGVAQKYAGDPANTPMGSEPGANLVRVKTSPADMKARVKARILASKRAGK